VNKFGVILNRLKLPSVRNSVRKRLSYRIFLTASDRGFLTVSDRHLHGEKAFCGKSYSRNVWILIWPWYSNVLSETVRKTLSEAVRKILSESRFLIESFWQKVFLTPATFNGLITLYSFISYWIILFLSSHAGPAWHISTHLPDRAIRQCTKNRHKYEWP
jgi:hypothetical protein